MKIGEIKQALVEVREMCRHSKCVTCPFHKMEDESDIPYCPLYEDEDGNTAGVPAMWDIADWMEDEDETD